MDIRKIFSLVDQIYLRKQMILMIDFTTYILKSK